MGNSEVDTITVAVIRTCLDDQSFVYVYISFPIQDFGRRKSSLIAAHTNSRQSPAVGSACSSTQPALSGSCLRYLHPQRPQ